MAHRTYTDAREVLQSMTDEGQLTPKQAREHEKELQRRIDAEVAEVHASQTRAYETMTTEGESLAAAMNEVEAAFEQLEADSRVRDMSAEDYRREFDALQRRRTALLNSARSLARRVEKYSAIEDDPEGYVDHLLSKYDALRPYFPW